ncbi:MAG: 50S ribosomal protein L13 [Candidatus Burarchaeum sp.]|nr:50S ribosomal protein L13 [Candidatus Burarchaeum sp.]MDO8339392.1 50S ribosomal protein L13 [Candidatus Burarchaeum sp.]
MVDKMMIVDAEDAVVGRLAADVAKLLLNGQEVSVVNCEKAVMSGEPSGIIAKYARRRLQKDKANPEHSPHISRRPDYFVKRIIRGMLPFKQPRGMIAFKKLMVYMGVPATMSLTKPEKLGFKKKDALHARYITVADLCKRLGYNG